MCRIIAGENSTRAEATKDIIQPFIDFGDEDNDLEEIKRKQDEELDLTGKKFLGGEKKPKTGATGLFSL